MNQVHFTFNNFFDYSIIVEQLKRRSIWIFNPNEFILTFPYSNVSEHAIWYIENLCKPLNIQFTTSLEVTEDSQWT